MEKEKIVSVQELKKYNPCFDAKKIINYFIDNKLYIIIPLILYAVLCLLTFVAVLSTMNGVKYEEICISNQCLEVFKKNFENVIKFHLAGAEYIMWMTTIISMVVAIYSYVVSVKVSMTTLSNSAFQDFKNILDNCIKVDSDLKSYHINYHKLFNVIYENSDEGDFSISLKYVEKLKRINSLIRSYCTGKSSRLHDDYANAMVYVLDSLGFNVKNRGRRYFHSDELTMIRFLNNVNKSILKENNIILTERALR